MEISFVDGGVVQIFEFYPSQSLGDDIDHIQNVLSFSISSNFLRSDKETIFTPDFLMIFA
jgi:hypothetical protein